MAMRTGLRKFYMAAALMAAAAGLLAGSTGCSPVGQNPRGQFPGEISHIKPGMTEEKIMDLAGPPIRIIEGEGISLGESTWVYPKGNIYTRRMVVLKVAEGEPEPEPYRNSLDRATERFMKGNPLHAAEEQWYRDQDEEEKKAEEARQARSHSFSLRPSVSRKSRAGGD